MLKVKIETTRLVEDLKNELFKPHRMDRINEFRIQGGFIRYRIKIWNDNLYEDENSDPQMDSQWFN